jgi:hypothetical protein
MLKSLHAHFHPIGKKGYLPPEPSAAMTEFPFPVNQVGDDSQDTYGQRSNGDARPNKNRPNHKNRVSCP